MVVDGAGRGGPSRTLVSLVLVLGICVVLSSEAGCEVMQDCFGKVFEVGGRLGLWVVHVEENQGTNANKKEVIEEISEEEQEILSTITEHCLPKLVCELYSKEINAKFSDAERTLMSLIGVTTLSSSGPTKYHFAAHMGQLTRGVEGTGCHEFFPICPFSGDDVRQIAKRIVLR